MTYSLYPHAEGFTTGNVIRESYLLNIPAVVASGSANTSAPLLALSADNIICEAIKPAAYRDDAFVVRLYEAERNKTRCALTVPADVKQVFVCNILEDVKEELPIVDGKVNLTFKPFQIISLMMVR
jgi:alpha-mannosidase